jgi:hypothetical protein
MHEAKPLNRVLIGFTLVVAISEKLSHTPSKSVDDLTHFIAGQGGLLGGALLLLVVVLLIPIMVAWVRALWNTVVPRVTGWREISFWEAAGVSALAILPPI